MKFAIRPLPLKGKTDSLIQKIAFKLVDSSHSLFNRPRGGWLAYEMQMFAHGLLGNGWSGCLEQLRKN